MKNINRNSFNSRQVELFVDALMAPVVARPDDREDEKLDAQVDVTFAVIMLRIGS